MYNPIHNITITETVHNISEINQNMLHSIYVEFTEKKNILYIFIYIVLQ